MPPRVAASMPAAASSKTTHVSGAAPTAAAPRRNTSGSGLAFVASVPSITASKQARRSQRSRIAAAFFDAEPSTRRTSWRAASQRKSRTPGSTSAGVIRATAAR